MAPEKPKDVISRLFQHKSDVVLLPSVLHSAIRFTRCFLRVGCESGEVLDEGLQTGRRLPDMWGAPHDASDSRKCARRGGVRLRSRLEQSAEAGSDAHETFDGPIFEAGNLRELVDRFHHGIVAPSSASVRELEVRAESEWLKVDRSCGSGTGSLPNFPLMAKWNRCY